MKILHAPTNIANQPWAIAEGLRTLGHEAEVWHYGPNNFDYPCDRNPVFPPESPRDLWKLVDEALDRFDVFHFHFGRSLIPRMWATIPGLWDLPLYGAAKKLVFHTFHGSDIRLKSQHIAENKWSYYRFADVPCDEDDIRKRLNIIRTYTNQSFICSPVNVPYAPDAAFHPRALQVDRWPYVGASNRDVPLVVHAPSRRSTKGTEFVEKAIEQARTRGLKFEFRLIEGLPNDEVRKVLSEADILIDNLLLGDYEVTGLEAMALGKVVVARLDDVVAKRIGPVPVQNADPDSIGDVLARLIGDPDLRARLGEEGRRFVEAKHDAPVVAAQIVRSYERPPGTLPLNFPDWAALGEVRREERLEQQLLDLRTAMKGKGRDVNVGLPGRAPFTKLGARLDAMLKKIVRAFRRA